MPSAWLGQSFADQIAEFKRKYPEEYAKYEAEHGGGDQTDSSALDNPLQPMAPPAPPQMPPGFGALPQPQGPQQDDPSMSGMLYSPPDQWKYQPPPPDQGPPPPMQDAQNPDNGLLQSMLQKRDTGGLLGGHSDMGTMLMALGGGIAGGASEGWGAGLGRGLTGAAAVKQRQNELAHSDALQKERYSQAVKIAQMKLDAAASAPPKMTNLQKNLAAAGLTEGSPEYNKAMLDAITHPNSTVNIGPGETAWETGINKNMAEQYTTMQGAAAAAQTKLGTLSALDDALGKAAYTGYGAKEVLALKKAAKGAGIDVGDVSGEEASLAIGNKLALQVRSTASGEGMPGSLSNADRDFLTASTPGLDKTPQGNKLLLDVARRTEKRNIDVYRKANKYIKDHGKLDPSFFDELADWSEKNPLFTDEDKKKAAAAGGGMDDAGGAAGGGGTNTTAGGIPWRVK